MNQTQIWKLSQLPEVEFFKAQYTNFEYAPHFHEDYAIGVVEHGIHAFYYRGANHAIAPNYVVTCQPGEVHNGHPGSDSPWRYRMLYIKPALICQIATELGYHMTGLPFLNQTAFNHPYVVRALHQLHQESEEQQPALAQEVQLREILAIVLANFSEIMWHPKKSSDEQAPIARAKQYIHEHYTDDLQLDDLAEVAHLSKSYFIRAFRYQAGLSPYAYLVQVRLNRAKTLLENGISATNAAHETGFFDQSHFNRYFKRFLGITPGRYRQTIG